MIAQLPQRGPPTPMLTHWNAGLDSVPTLQHCSLELQVVQPPPQLVSSLRRLQMPPQQSAVPGVQLVEHEPQCAMSVWRFAHSVSQHVWLGGHVPQPATQALLTQISVPEQQVLPHGVWPVRHAAAGPRQVPVEGFAQATPAAQHVVPQGVVPDGHPH
jgi:hypothetical protein